MGSEWWRRTAPRQASGVCRRAEGVIAGAANRWAGGEQGASQSAAAQPSTSRHWSHNATLTHKQASTHTLAAVQFHARCAMRCLILRRRCHARRSSGRGAAGGTWKAIHPREKVALEPGQKLLCQRCGGGVGRVGYTGQLGRKEQEEQAAASLPPPPTNTSIPALPAHHPLEPAAAPRPLPG